MCNKIIEIGITFLLVYTPLAFGGVKPGALAVLEILSGGLLLLWLVHRLLKHDVGLTHDAPEAGRKFFPAHSCAKKIFIAAALLFLAIIYLQSITLPAPIVKILSPAGYALYSEAALNTASSPPSRMPVSVYAYATENEWAKLVAYAIIFFLITRVIRTRKQIKRVLHVIFIMGSLEALYGFFQFFSATKLLDLYPAQANWIGGSFVNKNHFAGYLEMVIPLCFALVLTQSRRGISSQTKLSPEHFREIYPKMFLLLLALFFMIASLLLSGSRGGIVSFSCATMFFVLLARQRRLLRRKAVLVLIFIVLSIGLTILLNPDILTKRIYTFKRLESDSSFQVRRELWKSAFHIFQDYPISGAGLGSFTHLNPRYRTFRDHLRHYEYAENDYVQLLAETGIIGAVLLLLAGFTLGVQLFTQWKQRHSRWKIALVAGGMSAMLSLLIHSGTDFNLRIPSNALLFVTIAALCVNIVSLPSSRRTGSEELLPPLRNLKASGPKQATGSFFRVAVLLPILLLTALFLFQSAKRYFAERQYQYAISQKQSENSSTAEQTFSLQDGRDSFERAVRSAPSNADYHHAFGKFFFDTAPSDADAVSNVHNAEIRIEQAIMLNPASPWFYYDLGRMTRNSEDCDAVLSGSSGCASARYFRAALENAPKEMFLRKAVGHWFLYYDRTEGERLMRELAAGDRPIPAENPKMSENFAGLLYNFHLDDEAEQERSRRQIAEGHDPPARCRVERLSEMRVSDVLELGSDTGSADWNAPLKNETERIQKSICLPEKLADYRYSALKIFMNNGGRNNFTAHISVNEQRVKSFEQTIPQLPKWYEIPFDIRLFEGCSELKVYIRVEHASEEDNFLQIWGESQTANSHSTLNFDSREDLSSEGGIQRGEYLIRLVLKK
ncbi:MAG: O-antigen ligase family protein [bacterium]|nr:O-antigen ligase family protein [bacterium]